ncbi:cell division protein FtsL [Nocardioides sp. KIGAM211]|uniref:Cell division protein FtsL n=1 Tax=Nocardioides luti TaxID=2761101 RepID=A0A7X0RG03_9ACTN|nr:cell division protein FtsL [Nocardioides luti]MBB6626348.1 cell division protein FtsL [Nocardioides luti]
MSSPAYQLRTRVPRIAEAAVERARLTVVPRRRVRAARVPFVTLVSLVLLGGVVGLLMFNTSMQQASFAATSLEAQAGTLTAREQTLRMELDVLRDPQRVAQQARNMGMVTAGSPAFLNLKDGSITGEATPATLEGNIPINPAQPALPAILNPPPTHVEAPATGAPTGSSGNGDGKKKNNKSHTNNNSPADTSR